MAMLIRVVEEDEEDGHCYMLLPNYCPARQLEDDIGGVGGRHRHQRVGLVQMEWEVRRVTLLHLLLLSLLLQILLTFLLLPVLRQSQEADEKDEESYLGYECSYLQCCHDPKYYYHVGVVATLLQALPLLLRLQVAAAAAAPSPGHHQQHVSLLHPRSYSSSALIRMKKRMDHHFLHHTCHHPHHILPWAMAYLHYYHYYY